MSFWTGVPRAGVLRRRAPRDGIERWAEIGVGRGRARNGPIGGEVGASTLGDVVLGRSEQERAVGVSCRGEHALVKDEACAPLRAVLKLSTLTRAWRAGS